LSKIIVMTDQNGDENYQPMAIPIDAAILSQLLTTSLLVIVCISINVT